MLYKRRLYSPPLYLLTAPLVPYSTTAFSLSCRQQWWQHNSIPDCVLPHHDHHGRVAIAVVAMVSSTVCHHLQSPCAHHPCCRHRWTLLLTCHPHRCHIAVNVLSLSPSLCCCRSTITSLMEAAQQHWLHALSCRHRAVMLPRHEPGRHGCGSLWTGCAMDWVCNGLGVQWTGRAMNWLTGCVGHGGGPHVDSACMDWACWTWCMGSCWTWCKSTMDMVANGCDS